MQTLVLPEALSAPTWAIRPANRLQKGPSIPFLGKRDIPLCSANVETTGLMFGAACVAAATYSARHNSKQRHGRSIRWVARAQQANETSLPGRNKFWKELGLVMQEPSWPGKGLFQRLSRNDHDQVTIEELLKQIAKQRLINEDFKKYVDTITSPQETRLKGVRSELELAESRYAALQDRLKQAQEHKQELDQQEQVLASERNALSQTIDEQYELLQNILCEIERLEQSEGDNDAMC